MTKMNWEEYGKMFNCFPEIKKWIKDKNGNDYKVIQVRITDVTMEVRKASENYPYLHLEIKK